MNDVEYPESDLTQRIIGLAFDLFNEIGGGFPEKVYQNGLAEKFSEAELHFKRENYCAISLNNKRIGHFFVDFVAENKIVLEIKARNELFRRDISQTINYLKLKNYKVGLVLLFGDKKVNIKRLVV